MSQTWIHSPSEDQDAPATRRRRKARFGSGRAEADPKSASARRLVLAVALLVLTFLGLAMPRPAPAQDERRTKVPVIGKIAGGSTHQAFSGKVQSVDLKRNLLLVDTVEGSSTEFFPIKKNVPVETASGERLKVKELAPGTNVIVYYEVKEDRRSVSEIMVLGPGSEEKATDAKDKKKSAPPS